MVKVIDYNRQSFQSIVDENVDKVTIIRDPNGDSRYCDNGVPFDAFQVANDRHREDVRNVMTNLAIIVKAVGEQHDFTKKETEREFYNVFTQFKGAEFKEKDWYKYHTGTERHHLMSNCPDDVTLIDILEYIADCVSAGTARSGSVRKIELDDKILKKAFDNTCKVVENMVELQK